jgi:transposase
MSPSPTTPKRFIGLDIHKHYFVAVGLTEDLETVLEPQRVQMNRLEKWAKKHLTSEDAVAVEMTTNTWQTYDELLPIVHSVTVVHPPHVKLITRAQVMNDRLAAINLAKLHAKGLLPGIWVPTQEVRELRALVAQRKKMVRLAATSKNRLHAVLHRHHLSLPEQADPFSDAQRGWWLTLPLSTAEKICLISDLDTLIFAQKQVKLLENSLVELGAQDDRLVYLIQLTGVSLITAMTLLAGIGFIERFPSAKQLVGYAGLGARVHDSGQTTRTGRITKSGRRDIRAAMVETAWVAVKHDPHWKAEFKRLQKHLHHNKAIVAIARKLLVVVWHVLSKRQAYRFADPHMVARKLLQHAYRLGKDNRPQGQTTVQYVRTQLDLLKIGEGLVRISWGKVKNPIPLPPSSLLMESG